MWHGACPATIVLWQLQTCMLKVTQMTKTAKCPHSSHQYGNVMHGQSKVQAVQDDTSNLVLTVCKQMRSSQKRYAHHLGSGACGLPSVHMPVCGNLALLHLHVVMYQPKPCSRFGDAAVLIIHMLSHTCASDCVKLGTLDPKDDFGEATPAGIRQSRNPGNRAEALECALPRKIWVPNEVDRSPLSSLLLGWEAEP